MSPTDETLPRDEAGNLIISNEHKVPEPEIPYKENWNGGGCFGKGPGL